MVSELRIDRVLAPNPGPFTLTGTNTWIASFGKEAIVIDPGPRLADHEAAIVRGLEERRPSGILVTHNHEVACAARRGCIRPWRCGCRANAA